MFLVFESSFWFLNFTNKCLNFALIVIYPMKEHKLIELAPFLTLGSNGFCCRRPIVSAIVLSRSVT